MVTPTLPAVPLVSKMCPSDVYRVWKRGESLRVDTSLLGFEHMTWQRGRRSFIFKGQGELWGTHCGHEAGRAPHILLWPVRTVLFFFSTLWKWRLRVEGTQGLGPHPLSSRWLRAPWCPPPPAVWGPSTDLCSSRTRAGGRGRSLGDGSGPRPAGGAHRDAGARPA